METLAGRQCRRGQHDRTGLPLPLIRSRMPNLPGTVARCYRPKMTSLRDRPGDRASATAGEPVYSLDIMTQDDVPEVSRVERRCFANPWPSSAYRRELQNPAQNYYVVVRETRGSAPDNAPETDERGESKLDRDTPLKSVPRRALLPIAL